MPRMGLTSEAGVLRKESKNLCGDDLLNFRFDLLEVAYLDLALDLAAEPLMCAGALEKTPMSNMTDFR